MSQKQSQRKKTETPEPSESSLRRWLKERRITEVECLVPDITGNARGKIVPATKYSHEFGTRLPEGIFVTTVTGDYPALTAWFDRYRARPAVRAIFQPPSQNAAA